MIGRSRQIQPSQTAEFRPPGRAGKTGSCQIDNAGVGRMPFSPSAKKPIVHRNRAHRPQAFVKRQYLTKVIRGYLSHQAPAGHPGFTQIYRPWLTRMMSRRRPQDGSAGEPYYHLVRALPRGPGRSVAAPRSPSHDACVVSAGRATCARCPWIAVRTSWWPRCRVVRYCRRLRRRRESCADSSMIRRGVRLPSPGRVAPRPRRWIAPPSPGPR
jgi:hypothetical protein